jgi:8-oxo-dGTP pyrophosphatase MutT (NUDIX family)
MPSLPEIRSGLARHAPATVPSEGLRQAAVAMVLREAARGPEVLFIERAEREGDPWSGHMAFPGGRFDPGDADLRHAAERETREEVGLELAGAEPLGRLDDLQGHRAAGVPSIMIAAFVYHLPETPPLRLNHEVQDVFWFPLQGLHEATRHVEHPLGARLGRSMPGIEVGQPGRHVVWGLTYRFLEVFFEIVGRPLPDRWGEIDASSVAS